MRLRAEPHDYTLGDPMSSLLGRAFPALRPVAVRVPGPLDGFVDSLVQKLENCRPGLTDELLAKGPAEVDAWAESLYAEEVPRLKDAIRTEEPHLTREAREELFRKVDELVRKVVLPGWVRLASRFTPRERKEANRASPCRFASRRPSGPTTSGTCTKRGGLRLSAA